MTFEVAFCADPNMEVPLHCAAASLLKWADPGCRVSFNFLLTGFDEPKRKILLSTLDKAERGYDVRFLPTPQASIFRGFRPLHGNMMAYYRLVLPDLIQSDRLLYLDADTIPCLDVTPLWKLDMLGNALGAVEGGTVSDMPEKSFFASLGLNPKTPAFNSGVILFNLKQWHEQRRSAEVFDFCRKYPDHLKAADQTALIAVFAGDFTRLPDNFNIQLFPNEPEKHKGTGIFHFAGSPKPWDLFGSILHPRYDIYQSALETVAFAKQGPEFLAASRWRRAYHIKWGYYRTLRYRLLGDKRQRA
jgi:lipopolysaccharide biosynthesis glycosyltransferase